MLRLRVFPLLSRGMPYEAPKGNPEATDYRRRCRAGNNPERLFCGTLLS
jgi:hypothetical protein